MLSETNVGIVMASMQEVLSMKLENEGVIYPSLILMNEKRYVDVEDLRSKYPCILSVDISIGISKVFITKLTLRNHDENDDAAILELIREVTFKHQPEAVGYIAQCLYKPRKDDPKITTDEVNLDPDTIRVFHNCFFVKGGNEKGYLMSTPYVMNPLRDTSENDQFRFESDVVNVVTPVRRTWEVSSAAQKTRIPNPYL